MSSSLHEFADRLKDAEQHAEEMEAMLIIAQRARTEMLARRQQLLEANAALRQRQRSHRSSASSTATDLPSLNITSENLVNHEARKLRDDACAASAPSAAARPRSDAELYDWVCEITKLSDIGTKGWRVWYSDRFLRSMNEEQWQTIVAGHDPASLRNQSSTSPSNGTIQELDETKEEGLAGSGWDGAVIAVLGLFDKGKTFVLNHLTDSDLPSGKKVSTKGLSFKHVDVEGTKFVLLDSEGSYAPVRVENEFSVVEKEMSERFIQDVIFELADYFLCIVNDFTSLDQRYLDRLTRSLQNSKKVFQEVIVVHNCKTVMEASVMEHIFESQIKYVYGHGKTQTTRIAAVNADGILEEKDVVWFKTDFSRHILLANEDCELGDRTNRWVFALLKNWLRSAFVPVNRRFSVLQSVLQSCTARLSSYFKVHPELIIKASDNPAVKVIHARAQQDQMRLNQTSIDTSGLLLSRPNSFMPLVDIVQDRTYKIVLDIPGMTSDDIRLSRQNVTTIIKGTRLRPYPELLAQKVERQERTYGDFTLTFKVPQEYERKFTSATVKNGVLKVVYKSDTDEEGLVSQPIH